MSPIIINPMQAQLLLDALPQNPNARSAYVDVGDYEEGDEKSGRLRELAELGLVEKLDFSIFDDDGVRKEFDTYNTTDSGVASLLLYIRGVFRAE